MGSDSIPLWIIFIICVIGGGYFAATESSFSAVNKIKIKAIADDGDKRAKGVMYILNKFDKALTTLLVGNNVTKIGGAAVFTILATDIFKEKFNCTETFLDSFAFSVICSAISTAIIFLFSEMIPKSFANDRSESVSMFFEGSLRFLMKVLAPISILFYVLSDYVSKKFASDEVEPSITEDELTEIIDIAEEEGVVNEEEVDMLKSALEFPKTTVSDIMTMERDAVSISVNAPTHEILEIIRNTTHSRLPVVAANSSRVIGVLRTREFLTQYLSDPGVKLRSVMQPPYFVSTRANIDNVLTEMRQHKKYIAIVLDNSKKFVGLITVEDILEELVGEIFDEEDHVDQDFQPLGGNRYAVNTHMSVGEAYSRMGLENFSNDLVGKPLISYMLEILGHFPAEDETFIYNKLEFTAKSVEKNSVGQVIIHILDDESLAARVAEEVEA